LKKKNIFLLLLLFPVLCYVGICGYLFLFQRSIIYLPDKHHAAPNREKLPTIQEVTIKTDDGLELEGWYQPARPSKKTILYFNGNKTGMVEHEDAYRAFIEAGYGLLSINYRGYGTNAGAPSEEGLYKDARAAIAFLQAQLLPMEEIIFLGRSLGSGVAVQMATEYLPYAVVLVSPYTSIAAIGKMRYPYVPVDALLHDKFDSLGKMPQVQSPVLIFHGRADETIPISHAYTLHEAAKDSQLFVYDTQGHNDLDLEKIVQQITDSIENREAATSKITPQIPAQK
jgi:fermentation-respiration switch protein FrsA (DUF1100 family)